MAFGNITTLYVPTAANAGSSQWGTDVRKLLDAADTGSDATTKTDHGTGGAVNRTADPYTTSTTDTTEANFGWAITPSDMNSVSGARRYYPAGDHVLTMRFGHNGATGATGTLTMYVYRVASAASGRGRTLLGSNTASVVLPAVSGEVTAACTVTLAEVIFESDETVQYSLEFNVAGITIVGRIVTLFCGTQSSVAARVDTPKLGVLADTTGSSSGSVTVEGISGKVLGATGASSGVGTASGEMSATAGTTGSASGTCLVDGLASSVAGGVGSAGGTTAVSGLASIVLGTVGSVNIGSGGPADWPVISPMKTVAGAVLHHETGQPVVGATVRLIRDSDGLMCQSGTSGAGGSYSFDRDTDDPYAYHVSADYTDGGTQVHGLTDRGLVPA